ncbi:MAG: SLATT domain-containing protein [Magnetococcus sp. YQC-5]
MCSKNSNFKDKKNLEPHKTQDFKFKTSGECFEDAKSYYKTVTIYYEEAHQWYRKRKLSQSRYSKSLKFFSVWLGVIGGLAPFLISSTPPEDASCCIPSWLSFMRHPEHFGYVLLALSGSMILFDKMFGFSTNWMRCIEAMRSLEATAAKYEQQWILKQLDVACMQSITPPPDEPALFHLCEELFTVATDYKQAILECLGKETQAWLAEFRSNLARMEESKPSK